MRVYIHRGQISAMKKMTLLTAESRPRWAGLFASLFMLVTVLLSACATSLPPTGNNGRSPAVHSDASTQQPSEAELLYELLVGEIAGQRGAVEVSAENYLRAARQSDDPRIAERAAKIAVFAGDDEKALEAARRWVTLAPDDTEAQQVVAIMYLRNRQVDEAVPFLEKVRASHMEQPQKGFMFVAQLLSREQDREIALKAMSRLVEKHPEDADALFAYAHLATRAKQYSRAHQLMDKVMALRPNWSDAYVLRANLFQAEGDIDAASKAFQEAIRFKPDDLDVRLSYARMLVEERRFVQAKQEFKQLEKRAPDNADVLFALGLLALQSEHPDEARKYFSTLIHNGQRVSDASFFLGRLAESEENDAEALRWYKKVNGGGNFAEAQIRIAILTARQGDMGGARQILNNLAQDNPRLEVRTILVEGDILRVSGQDSKAFEVLGRGLEKFPNNPELLYSHAMVAERIGQIEVLEQNLNRMLQADPDNAQALNALGYTLADRTDRYDEAYRYIQRALELEPDDAAILDSMGWVLYRMGRYPESIKYLRRALEKVEGGDAEIAAHLGEVLWVSGDQEGARKVWEQAQKQHPDDDKLRDVIQRYLK